MINSASVRLRRAGSIAQSRSSTWAYYPREAIRTEAGVDSILVAHQVFPNLRAGDQSEVGLRMARFIIGLLESEESRGIMTGMLRAATTEPKVIPLVQEFLSSGLLGPLAESLSTVAARIAEAIAPVLQHYLVDPL